MPENNSQHKLWYQQPASNWVEALPVGNGRLGAMVFGGVAEERLQLNEDTLWSGGPKDWNNPEARALLPEVRRLILAGDYAAATTLALKMQGPYVQSYQPLGDLYLSLDIPPDTQAEPYYRDLNLDTAVATTRYQIDGITYPRTIFASFPDQVIAIRLTASQPGSLSFTARLDSQLCHSVVPGEGETLILRGKAPAHVEPSFRGDIPNPVVYEDSKGMGCELHLRVIADDGSLTVGTSAIQVTEASAVTILVSAATSYNGYDRSPVDEGADPAGIATRHLERVLKVSL